MQRRTLLQGLLLGLLPLSIEASPRARALQPRWISPRSDQQGRHWLTALDAQARPLWNLPLPGRAHGLATHPESGLLVAPARRPGRFLQVVDLASGRVLHTLESRADRHFFGHAVFSRDGRRLYTTENDFASGQGVIGVRDPDAGFAQIDELPSHGVGPHELALLSDGETLVIANGGIRTHPDTPRAMLNLDSMAPSLVYLNRHDGKLLEQVTLAPEWHQNSIRHLALDANDQICFGMQYQGSKQHRPPLVALHRLGRELQLCSAPDAIQQRMRNYCGSVLADPAGAWFAVSSPRGGLTTLWRGENGDYLGSLELVDGCGLAAGPESGELLLSSGQGKMLRFRPALDRSGESHAEEFFHPGSLDARWDNHMLTV